MNDQFDKINRELMKQKSTYSYMFSEKQTKADKDVLMRQFVKQLFDFDV